MSTSPRKIAGFVFALILPAIGVPAGAAAAQEIPPDGDISAFATQEVVSVCAAAEKPGYEVLEECMKTSREKYPGKQCDVRLGAAEQTAVQWCQNCMLICR